MRKEKCRLWNWLNPLKYLRNWPYSITEKTFSPQKLVRSSNSDLDSVGHCFTFESLRVLRAVSSSRMFLFVIDRTSKILSSVWCRARQSSAHFNNKVLFFSSNSGASTEIIIFNNRFSNSSAVISKLIRVTWRQKISELRACPRPTFLFFLLVLMRLSRAPKYLPY